MLISRSSASEAAPQDTNWEYVFFGETLSGEKIRAAIEKLQKPLELETKSIQGRITFDCRGGDHILCLKLYEEGQTTFFKETSENSCLFAIDKMAKAIKELH